ncbi:hypothetical protein pEaSNUABM35_00025 [Erwinia phage pEa_SNUABM_35]|uniref:Uncharacterized protein n=1 Tax=Erwinia phage pEa_SNUABM_35 TaxID=2869557 RepID=A0AAE7XQV8_9CAUD|nr:hypothetical protein MPK65_gp025 [Erwinia phage pEa_SNUABM_35]QZE59942.1 hypothetical protein pEaSNUABM35_00025 [Erwinia phage pEa_SNUABM_35]QZE60278.1 hypothetical protein pEaSNUABM36_00025 [Erwinia phage pEa_SNUABM_36]
MMEQEMKDMPVHIVNGFQFSDNSLHLLSYALDMARLGGTIGPDFWEAHIVENVGKVSISDTLMISGPIIRAKDFSIFDSLEQCRKDAQVVFEALLYGFDTLMQEFREVLLGDAPHKPNTSLLRGKSFSNELLSYLTRVPHETDMELLDVYRRQACALCDAEPVLMCLRLPSDMQYLWNGEWRALIKADAEIRSHQFHMWYYNHAFTKFRMQAMSNCYLYTKHPEHFNRG